MSYSFSSPISRLPGFLQDYGSLIAHFDAETRDLTNVEKGDKFVDFSQKLVPQTLVGQRFGRLQKNPKRSHDGGIDLFAEGRDSSGRLCVQAKYSIAGVEEFDSIMSKFQDYETQASDAGQLGLPLPTLELEQAGEPLPEYLVITLQTLNSVTLPRYRRSRRSSLDFFKQLESEQRIHIVDGPQVYQYLQELYRRSFVLPSSLRLTAVAGFVSKDRVYVGIVPGPELKRLYDEFGAALFLENIREYLGPKSGRVKSGDQREAVNEAIAATLNEQPGQFLARNNGITFRASRIVAVSPETLELDDASIVNGCQTTMSIVANPQPTCHVVVKVVEAQDGWDVAQAANFQNEIERVALKLARHIRPQAIREAASRFSVRLDGAMESSPFSVLDAIYEQEITEEAFRSLFLALFSRSPRNALETNYTEVNSAVVDEFFEPGDLRSDTVYEVLFHLNQLAKETAISLEQRLANNEDLLDLFRRFWGDSRPGYRAFISVLAACGCTGKDVYSGSGRPTYDDMQDFIDALRVVLDQTPSQFSEYYRYAFVSVGLEALRMDQSRDQILQRMHETLASSSFPILVQRMRLLAQAI